MQMTTAIPVPAFERIPLGTAADDLVVGNAGNEIIRGSPGADAIDGGAGYDVVDYGDSTAGVAMNLGDARLNGGGYGGGDRLTAAVRRGHVARAALQRPARFRVERPRAAGFHDVARGDLSLRVHRELHRDAALLLRAKRRGRILGVAHPCATRTLGDGGLGDEPRRRSRSGQRARGRRAEAGARLRCRQRGAK